jgi:hypothetical protein
MKKMKVNHKQKAHDMGLAFDEVKKAIINCGASAIKWEDDKLLNGIRVILRSATDLEDESFQRFQKEEDDEMMKEPENGDG